MRKIHHRLTPSAFLLFLAGLGSMTEVHVVGSIAITELVMFAAGPILFVVNFHRLRREGFLPFAWLALLTCAGCIVSSKVNGTYWLWGLKALAVPGVYFVAIVTFHHLLRKDLSAMKWFIIGGFLSGIICVFVFQPETHTVRNGVQVTGLAAAEAVMGYALFWTSRINALIQLPVRCFYLSTPFLYSCLAPLVASGVAVLGSNASGRSAAAMSVCSLACLLCGGKSRKKIAKLGKNLFLLFVALMLAALAFKAIYSRLAKSGMLGEAGVRKYERQTATGTGILSMLMAGRMELFCGLQACLDYPIIGLGPRAEDRYGYIENYLQKYASQEDFENYLADARNQRRKYGYFYELIPAHSHIVYFWLWYGIFGLFIWLYVFWMMYKYFRAYAFAIPQWYGYMCLSIPALCWDILFSPPGGRLSMTFFITCLHFCRAVALRKINLPMEMQVEAYHAT